MATIKVLMVPSWDNVSGHYPSGIKEVVKAYTRHFLAAGIELVSPKATSFDVLAVHAGMTNEYPIDAPLVGHLHGLYWSADYPAADWEFKVNRDVINCIRHATTVTVPSSWVAEPFQRDLHYSPVVVPHGVDWQDWQHDEPNEGYILGYAKNRAGSDVCNPIAMGELAQRFPQQRFLGTFAPPNPTPNVKVTGIVKHDVMRRMVQRAAVVVSSVKETAGILHLEAMASGIPLLGFRQGGICDHVTHGVNGFLATPGNYDELAEGLAYCLKHREVLGANGRDMAKRFTWEKVAQQLHGVYAEAMERFHQPPTVTVVIPAYNYSSQLPRAVESAAGQATEVIIVDNNSTDNTAQVASELTAKYQNVRYVNEERQGVAHARNRGIREATTKYIVPLDADDAILPGFVAICVKALQTDRSLGIAYTRLQWVKGDGSTGYSDWPGKYNFDEFLKKHNQVSTCCMFRREMWERLGGYRQRYAPAGAGAEDAEFFLRAGAMGWDARLVSEEALFVYSWGTGQVSGNKNYQEANWLAGKPWIEDKKHPFASMATPAKMSHEVKQYDDPTVSVIIPCGINHQQYLVDALDSLEAQTFRKWEAIVICDGFSVPHESQRAFPFVRWVECTSRGAGAARNVGAKLARAPFLLFLDADDWLRPHALHQLLSAYNSTGAIAYSDYAGHAFIEGVEVERLKMAKRLESYNDKTHEAVVIHKSFDYDCERAIAQPQMNAGEFYVWNLITSLVPRRWHNEVGGFDEQMESWEDWDYWIRLARAGKCFSRIPELLVDYRFYTGTRRETGRQIHKSLLEYMTGKYREGQAMPCGSCGGRKQSMPAAPAQHVQMAVQARGQMTPANIVWVKLNDNNQGDHPIVGHITRQQYGYRKHGDVFKMMQPDVMAAPHKFIIVPDPATVPAQIIEPEPTPAPEPTPIAQFVEWPEPKRRVGRPKRITA